MAERERLQYGEEKKVLTEFDAGVVIANLFAGGMQKVSIRQMNETVEELSKRFHMIYIHADTDTILGISQSRPDMFCRRDNCILRGSWSDPQQYTQALLDGLYLPDTVKQALICYAKNNLDTPRFLEIFTQYYVDRYYNWRIPEEIRAEFVAVCQKFAKRYLKNKK